MNNNNQSLAPPNTSFV